MSYNLVDPTTGDLTLVAGGTLWADSPIGSILPYGGNTAPSGWMICDGTSLLRASYPELFAVIGTAFGSADSTHFNIPDMTGKTAMGVETDHALGASEVGALPNIKSANQPATVSWATGTETNPDSAIYPGGEAFAGGTAIGGAGAWNYIKMDASRSNSIYTDGQTKVDPANVRVNYIIKAKMCAMPSDFMSKVDEAVEEALGEDTGWQSIGSYGSKYRVKNGLCTLFVSEKRTINLDANGGANLSGTLPSSIRPSFDLVVPAYVYGYTGDVTWGKTQNNANIRTDGVIRLSSGIVNDFITEVEFVVTYPIN